jgi:hypothetical protein
MSLHPGQFVWPSCTAVGIAMPRTGVALLVSNPFVGYPFVGKTDRDGP